jgi:tetratricopeptide (TPR) repeat protein
MKSQRWFSLGCVIGLICCVAGLIVGTWGKTRVPVAGVTPPKSAPVNEYIDSRLCAFCHRQIYENYRQTGMAKSLFKPAPANTIEDYKGNTQFYHSLSDTHFSMIFRDQAYYQRRWQIGFDGNETNVEETKIDYVIGAGDHSRAYLHRTTRGTLIELPLGWYTERGGYWGMSPGFDSGHPDTRRLVSYACVFCHDAYPQVPSGSDVSGAAFTGDLPEGIDCQRCHGPGGQHIRAAQAGAESSDISSRIVNPARLSSKLQMELCMQCHLEPTTGQFPAIVRRFNRGIFSYIPGQPIEDYALYFDHAPNTGYDDKFQFVSVAYRLRKSRCFLESKGALTCLSCHDPHRKLPAGEEATSYYSGQCRHCHEPGISDLVAQGKHPHADDCVSCHMPKRRTEDVVHAVITDHFIQRKVPMRDLQAELQERHSTDAEEYHGEVVPYYPSPLPKTNENSLYVALAQVARQNNLKKGVADLAQEVNRHPPREEEFYIALGDAWKNTGDSKAAVGTFEQAVRTNPKSVTALRALAASLKTSGDVTRSEQILKRAIDLAPLDGSTWNQYAMLDADLGQTDLAIEELQKALALDPDLPEGDLNLATLLVREAQMERAETALKRALSIDPYNAAAYDLMGRVLASKNETSMALYSFQKATHLRPDYGPYLYNYALAFVAAQRLDEARTQAQAAVNADRNLAESHVLLGRLLAKDQGLANKPIIETFEARLRGGERLRFEIEELSTDQDVQELAKTYGKGGKDDVERDLRKLEKGRYVIRGKSYAIRLVRSTSQNGTRSVFIIADAADRASGDDVEMGLLGHRGYPFAFTLLRFDQQGKGQGQQVPFAAVTFNKQGVMDIESMPVGPGASRAIRLEDARAVAQ